MHQICRLIVVLFVFAVPHNLYLHSGLVLSRAIDKNNEYKVAEGNYYNAMESAVALFVSFWINAAIVSTFSHVGAVFRNSIKTDL